MFRARSESAAAAAASRVGYSESRKASGAAWMSVQEPAASSSSTTFPAYAIAVPYSDNTQRWQLYAGAYRDTASAAPMRALLDSAGLTPTLVTRTGLAAVPDDG